jgi:hypothetical protein
MIVPLRIRRLMIILLPLSILGAGFGMYRHHSSISATSALTSIASSEEFGTMHEYEFHFGETTGHALYVTKNNKTFAINFDEKHSNRLALGALLGCDKGYCYKNGSQCLVLVGQMSRKSYPCEENKLIGIQTSDYTFRLQHWYLSENPCGMHSKEYTKHQWKRSDFINQPEYGFNPNSTLFNPHLYEKPLPSVID